MGDIHIKDLHDDSKADLHTNDFDDDDNKAGLHTKDIKDDKNGDLDIKNVKVVDQGKRIFEVVNNMFIPTHNVTIKCSDAASLFYRAFGRILGYCILHQEKIANHAMVSCLCDK
jgi:hypothetical protein